MDWELLLVLRDPVNNYGFSGARGREIGKDMCAFKFLNGLISEFTDKSTGGKFDPFSMKFNLIYKDKNAVSRRVNSSSGVQCCISDHCRRFKLQQCSSRSIAHRQIFFVRMISRR